MTGRIIRSLAAAAALTAHTADGENVIDLTAPGGYAAMIDHVLVCLAGRADLIEPASALPALKFPLEVCQRLLQPAD